MARPGDIGCPFEKARSFGMAKSGVAMAFLGGNVMGCNSLRSITTALDVRNALATEAECSMQHLTTCTSFQDHRVGHFPFVFHGLLATLFCLCSCFCFRF